GTTRAIVQSPDGYLWLGTEFGLVRFDGVRFVPWRAPAGQHLPSNNIRSLAAARDGTLWIGTVEGLASWNHGTLKQYPELAGQNVLALFEDREGTVWAGTFATPSGRLCAIQRGNVKCYGADGSLGQWVYTIYEDNGQLWVHTGRGVWRWRPGPPAHYHVKLPGSFESSHTLVQGDHGAGLIAIANGKIQQIAEDEVTDYPLSTGQEQFTALNLLRDRNGALWVGTLGEGLLRVHNGKTNLFAQTDGLSGDRILSLFEDREGNIWVGTADGLDSFREFAVRSFSAREGLSSPTIMAVLAARDNSVWLSGLDGLSRWNNGHLTIYHAQNDAMERSRVPPRPQLAVASQDGLLEQPVTDITDPGLPDDQAGSLFEDDQGRVWVSTPAGIARFEGARFNRLRDVPGGWVNTITKDGNGGLWISYEDYGLLRVVNEKVVERIPWSKFGGMAVASVLIADRIHGGLWLGFFQGGVVYFKDGQVRASYGRKEGLGRGRVMDLELQPDGTLWAATEGGLSSLRNGRIITLTSRNGLPCDTVHWAVQDDASSVWLYTPCGLLRVPRTELDAWVSDPSRSIHFTVFDSADGVRTHALLTGYTPRVSKSVNGQLWFVHIEGASMLDPRHLAVNKLPPPVHIEQIIADGKAYNSARELRLPARVRNVTIKYTALSLVAPEKVHFRYKLEGQDPDWSEVVNDRDVQYSNLRPRNYTFRVVACNNSGLWNKTGDTLEFSIAPAYYQTNWFRAACVAMVLAIVWALYRLRLGQMAQRFHARLEERVSERTRIARELHDTLLQSVQASLLQMQVARTLISRRPEHAVETLDHAISSTEAAIAEGR
ncbi:MAG: hypothetical protein JO319_21180, partial [Acidobacteriaceae bacterium]|nr:hypothetical protein [Acidobacteriaceae bacterium]